MCGGGGLGACSTIGGVWRRSEEEVQEIAESLDDSRRTFLGVFASLVVLSEGGITRLLGDDGRVNDKSRRKGGFGGEEASGSLALGDEVGGAPVGDDLEVGGATGVEEVDGGRGPLTEEDGPLFLSHGEVLGVEGMALPPDGAFGAG